MPRKSASRPRSGGLQSSYARSASGPSRRVWWGLGGGALAVAAVAALLLGAQRPEFDKERSFQDLERQVRFGPRVPNTDPHVQCGDYLLQTLKPLADSAEAQSFTLPVRNKTLRMRNVIAQWKGTGGKDGVLLCAHWDTRPQADQERDPRRARQPIPGANDGASGVAVLLEAARAFKKSPPPVPVMIVFFDGEDYGPGEGDMYLGARYFAAHLPADTPKRGVLLDMIGDRDLSIPREFNSKHFAGDVQDEVWAAARKLSLDHYFPETPGLSVDDDHVPLQEKGIKCIDLIDFDYGPNNSWWHTLDDTPDKCSPTSLKVVGDVILEWTYTRH
jgi:glutaminyl-peptide cyclotransferase